LYEMAARQHSIPAMYHMCQFLSLGIGCQRDEKRAKLYFQQLSECGSRLPSYTLMGPDGLQGEYFYELGICHARGMGVSSCMYQAKECFIVSGISFGHGEALLELGRLFES